MVKATLKMKGCGENCWDALTLVIKGGPLSAIIRLQNRNTALDVYRQLFTAHFTNQTGTVAVEIDGVTFQMDFDTWQAVLGCVDQWYEEYMSLVELASNY